MRRIHRLLCAKPQSAACFNEAGAIAPDTPSGSRLSLTSFYGFNEAGAIAPDTLRVEAVVTNDFYGFNEAGAIAPDTLCGQTVQ